MRPLASLTLLRTQTDARLIELARAGHERAFEVIVERYRRELLRACRRILPDGRAEDALQQTFLAAWTSLRDGTDVAELRGWLHRIARNTSLNALRIGGFDYDELRESLAAPAAVGDEAERRAVMRQTLAAVAALPEKQREALLRTAVQGSPQDQIARDLGVTSGAVRQLVHRARTTLRSAATAITPLPFALWLAAAGARAGEPLGARIAEAAAGAGTVSVSAALAKAGAVVVIGTGAAIGTPIALDRIDGTVDGPAARSAAAAGESPSPAPSPSPSPSASPPVAPAPSPTAAPARAAVDDQGRQRRRGRGRNRGRGGDDRDDDRRSSNSGPGGGVSSGSGPSGGDEPDDDRSGSSGSGSSGGDDADDDSSGSGSGTSSGGDDSSGTGSGGGDSSASSSGGEDTSDSDSGGEDSSGSDDGDSSGSGSGDDDD